MLAHILGDNTSYILFPKIQIREEIASILDRVVAPNYYFQKLVLSCHMAEIF